jgi:DNA-binding response OmpR family regulator
MKQQRILVVDDERNLCDILLYNLSMAGYEAVAAFSAEEALEKEPAGFDLILLDVMLPGLSGYELAQKLKTDIATNTIPIVFLSAMGAEDDKLHGFDLGADDYIPKPFSVREVLARIKAVLGRTSQAHSVIQELSYEGLKLNMVDKSVSADGKEIQLTKTEYEILKLFLEHRGQVFSRQEILDKVWPQGVVVSDRTVDVNITRMRKKIGRYSSCIATRQGFGYLFVNI